MSCPPYLPAVLFDDSLAGELFPSPACSGAYSASDMDVSSYFSFDDNNAETEQQHAGDAVRQQPLQQHCETDAVARAAVDVSMVDTSKTTDRKRRQMQTVNAAAAGEEQEMRDGAGQGCAGDAVEAVLVGQTKAAKKVRMLARIALPSPSSPASLSPSFSSGPVSPVSSLTSSESSLPSASPSPVPCASASGADVQTVVSALMAESALKRSRLARKAELARIGRKRKTETIDRYSAQVEQLQKELKQAKQALDRERKQHKRAIKQMQETQQQQQPLVPASIVKVKQEPVSPPPATVATVVSAPVSADRQQPPAASQSLLRSLAVFCKERGVESSLAAAACSSLLSHMRGLLPAAAATTAGDGYMAAVQASVVSADSSHGLLARFLCWLSAQPVKAETAARADVGEAWAAMVAAPSDGGASRQLLEELSAWSGSRTAMVEAQ